MTRSSFIYAVTEDGQQHKIGHTRDLRRRLANLQTSHSKSLVFSAVICVPSCRARAIEKKIHEDFAWRRVRGEWFRMSCEEAREFLAFARIRWLEDDTIKPAFPRNWIPEDPARILEKHAGMAFMKGL